MDADELPLKTHACMQPLKYFVIATADPPQGPHLGDFRAPTREPTDNSLLP